MISFPFRLACAIAATALVHHPASASEPIQLGSPLKCEFGVDCFVQNFIDHDAGPGVRDFHCGGRTYNTHNGTDFRVPDDRLRKAGVEVLSMAPGRVARTRDGVDDISIRVGGREAVKGRECGNAVVIEHAGGWSTQYCHMAKGSVRVKPGDSVSAGQPIGLVGLSGDTEFSHVHVTVRQDNNVVDPYAYGAPAESCGGGASLWDPKVAAAVAYKEGEVLNFGFSSAVPTMEMIETGEIQDKQVAPKEPLLAYVRIIGLKAGDVQSLVIRNPSGAEIVNHSAKPLDGDRAQQFISAGRRAQANAWPPGSYTAVFTLTRGGKPVLTKTFTATMPDK